MLTACSGTSTPTVVTPPAPTLPLRPAGTFDYYVIGISGKCAHDELGRACWNILPASLQTLNTKNNYNYLVPRKTVPLIVNAIYGKGHSVAYRGYAASLEDRINTGSGITEQHPGFMTLATDVANIYKTAINGFSNPSKLVFVAHSHGVVWAHLFSTLYPQVPIEMEFDFDGVCAYWQTDNKGDFERLGYGNITDFEGLCRTRDALSGGNPTDMHNITQPNVRYNVEIQSNDWKLSDGISNRRPDGTATRIYSAKFQEDHSRVTEENSQGLAYAVQWAAALAPSKMP